MGWRHGGDLRLLLVSTAVADPGSGVPMTIRTLADELGRRGHRVDIVAPGGALEGVARVVEVAGTPQVSVQSQPRDSPVSIPPSSMLAQMWDHARTAQRSYDLICNFGYDWLPFYLTRFFSVPILHVVSMASQSNAVDEAIADVARDSPHAIAFHTRAQACTYGWARDARCVGNGVELSRYTFRAAPEPALAWAARISPEKGLEDAVAVAERTGLPLRVFGALQDAAYWHRVREAHPDARVSYAGFLSTFELQAALGRCCALLMTHRWVEAFGNVAIEALACGVPVIAYRRGGPAEIVLHGRTGWLVEPDSIDGLVDAVGRVPQIDRRACRRQAETDFSSTAFGDRVESWFRAALRGRADRGRRRTA